MRKILTGVVLAVIITLCVHPRFLDETAAQAPPQQPGGVPMFQVDPSWAKVPEKWKLGLVSSVSVDAQDHVWILHRPRTLAVDQRPWLAPAVLEFDAAGNFVQAWGGPGGGYDGWGRSGDVYDWPENEHGIHVDDKGYVWVGGNNCPERNQVGTRPVRDDQLLKFARDGKFVMQIGRPNESRGNNDTKNVRMPAEAVVYPKTNEVIVADGYGNRRVIVFDADTGAFKRMWGAFGNKPVDAYRCPTQEYDRSVIGSEGPGPLRFDVVHAVRVSNDGFVYVGDRNYRRLQVFTIDGKFVNQVFFGRTTNGSAGAVAFSPDPEQKFMYVASAEIVVLNRKTLEILGSVAAKSVHGMDTDSKGNLYTAHLGAGAGSASQGGNVQKWVFKGLSPAPK